jgi:DNA-directed RNA polymerases I, II, and III subunit RPABC2
MDEDGDLNAPDIDEEDIDESEDVPTTKSRTKLLSKTAEYDENDSDSDENTDDSESNDVSDLEDEEDEEEDDALGDEENEDGRNAVPGQESVQQNSFLDIEDDEDENEGDDDENYLQKFDESIQQHIIEDFHPDLKMHNYEEIEILSRIVRDPQGNIIDPLHKTLPFLTRYEKARVIGERAKQINAGAKPAIEIETNIIDGYLIAMKEFEEKKIPFIIKRPLPNGGCEYWRVSDLEILS